MSFSVTPLLKLFLAIAEHDLGRYYASEKNTSCALKRKMVW
jgi:hypothetical protein